MGCAPSTSAQPKKVEEVLIVEVIEYNPEVEKGCCAFCAAEERGLTDEAISCWAATTNFCSFKCECCDKKLAAYSFVEKEGVAIGGAKDLGLTENFTLSCWVKPNKKSGTQSIISQKEATADECFFLSIQGGKAVVGHGMNSHQFASGSKIISENRWTHLVVAFDKKTGTHTILVDGVPDVKISGHKGLTNNKPVYLGASGNTALAAMGHKGFDGSVAGLRVHKQTLSVVEAKNLASDKFGTEGLVKVTHPKVTYDTTLPINKDVKCCMAYCCQGIAEEEKYLASVLSAEEKALAEEAKGCCGAVRDFVCCRSCGCEIKCRCPCCKSDEVVGAAPAGPAKPAAVVKTSAPSKPVAKKAAPAPVKKAAPAPVKKAVAK